MPPLPRIPPRAPPNTPPYNIQRPTPITPDHQRNDKIRRTFPTCPPGTPDTHTLFITNNNCPYQAITTNRYAYPCQPHTTISSPNMPTTFNHLCPHPPPTTNNAHFKTTITPNTVLDKWIYLSTYRSIHQAIVSNESSGAIAGGCEEKIYASKTNNVHFKTTIAPNALLVLEQATKNKNTILIGLRRF